VLASYLFRLRSPVGRVSWPKNAIRVGRTQEALELAEQALGETQQIDSLSCEAAALQAWGQVLAKLESARWDEAEAHFAQSLRPIESMRVRIWSCWPLTWLLFFLTKKP
jgi:hypothetical protein